MSIYPASQKKSEVREKRAGRKFFAGPPRSSGHDTWGARVQPEIPCYTKRESNIADTWKMGARDWVDVFPIKNGDFPDSYVIVYQRVAFWM